MVRSLFVFEHLPPSVTIYEVGPRDGLQNEARMIPTDDKIAFIDALSGTGLPAIEITSFVNPRWIPQLADGAEVSRRITRRPGIVYSALVPNRQGLDAAIAAGMREVAVFMSASETHNKKNVNKTIAATLAAFQDTVPPALAAGLRVRAYVSTVYGCPYEGAVDPGKAVELCRQLRQADAAHHVVQPNEQFAILLVVVQEPFLQKTGDEVGHLVGLARRESIDGRLEECGVRLGQRGVIAIQSGRLFLGQRRVQ